MFRAIPRSSKILDDLWNKKRMEQHKRNLRTIKPMVETHVHATPVSRLGRKSKKEQLFEGEGRTVTMLDRCTEIERGNRILLEKMTHIMQLPKRVRCPQGKHPLTIQLHPALQRSVVSTVRTAKGSSSRSPLKTKCRPLFTAARRS